MNKQKKFFKKLKDEGYTILLPNMLPTHFALLARVFELEGYKAELLEDESDDIKEEGLKNIHNDACYPALLVAGSFIKALKSGKYDLNKVALIITQTGGGCRASNYLPLIKKAIKDRFPQVPVISLNASRLEKEHSLPLNLRFLLNMACSVFYGDLIMNLYNQIVPYELIKGSSEKAKKEAFDFLVGLLNTKSKYRKLKKNYQKVIDIFKKVQIAKKDKPKVGIVGEIFVKYSSLANNQLIDFLLKENCEPVLPSLVEFLLYCLVNNEIDFKLYSHHKFSHFFVKLGYKILYKMSKTMNEIIEKNGFTPYEDFKQIRNNCHYIISQGVKMGEGWLIPSEIFNFAKNDVLNIVCLQPFGCLPNHIVGKGMVRPLKKFFPNLNIALIDYDPGASKVNQENRIKLMLSAINDDINS